MKKLLLSLVLLFFCELTLNAQKLELSAMAGYTFPSSVDYYSGYGKFSGNVQYTGTMELPVNKFYGVQLMYSQISTDARIYDYVVDRVDGRVNFSYIMAGANRYFGNPDGKVKPYTGIDLGAAIISHEAYASDFVRFAVGLKLGTKVYFNDAVAFRIHMQALSPIQSAGAGLSFGTGGVGAGVSTYSSLLQFGISGGFVFAIGTHNK